MWMRAVLLLVLAGGVGYGTIQLAQQWLAAERAQRVAAPAPEAPPPEPEPATFVLVAAKDLTVGRFVDSGDLRWQGWPDDNLPDTYLVQGAFDPQMLAGAVARDTIPAGQPIMADHLVRPGDRGFLAAVLGPGMRAVTVPIDPRSGIAGFVHPGDRVDLILTHRFRIIGDVIFNGLAEIDSERTVSETVLRDMRVLAIDQVMDDPGEGARIASLATLEVTPRQAEIINVMLEIGSLSLSLRSLADPQQPDILHTLASFGLDMSGPQAGIGGDPYVGTEAILEPVTGRTVTFDSDVSQVVPALEDLILPSPDVPKPDVASVAAPAGPPAEPSEPVEVEVTIYRGSAAPTARN
jgi:pilus assembly protein CpaB